MSRTTSKKFHVSSKTGLIDTCRASTGRCPFIDASDPEQGHYSSIEEVEAYIERKNLLRSPGLQAEPSESKPKALPENIKRSTAYKNLHSGFMPSDEGYKAEELENFALRALSNKLQEISEIENFSSLPVRSLNKDNFTEFSPRDNLEIIRSHYGNLYRNSVIRSPERLLPDGSNLQESSVAEIDDFILESCEALSELDTEEIRSLTLWTGEGYLFASKKDLLEREHGVIFRDKFEQWTFESHVGIVKEVPDKDVDAYLDLVNSSIRKAEKSNSERVLYRGIREETVLSKGSNGEYLESYREGTELELDRISSFTIDPTVARNFGNTVLEIKTSKGVGISPISEMGVDELEVLMAKGTKFRAGKTKKILDDTGNLLTVIELEDL